MLCNMICNTKKKEPCNYKTLYERETGIEPVKAKSLKPA